MLACRVCGEVKPLSEFYFRRDTGKRRAACRACNRLAGDSWRARNPDSSKAISLAWARKNLDKIRSWKRANPERAKKWDREHPDRVAEMKKAWKQRNPHKILADVRARQASKLRATPKWANLQAIEAIYASARMRGLEVDHIVPLRSRIVCGLHCEANLEPIPFAENRTKGNRMWQDMPT